MASDVIITIRTQLYGKITFLWGDNKNRPKLRMINTLPIVCMCVVCVCVCVCVCVWCVCVCVCVRMRM